jgi:gliding motility-associated-like protein
MIARLLVILILVISQIANAIDNGPEILRICLDNNSSSVTLYWKSPSDNCNSFKFYKIYSSENNGPWLLNKTINSISASEHTVILSDLTSDWKFKLVTYSSCNSTDSFISNYQTIDQSKPPLLELDSVSFDNTTQKLSAGWKKNFAPDTKGYWLYNLTPTDYDKILDTDNTFTILPSFDFTNPSKIALSTFDSCNLFAPISGTQKAAYLNGKVDTCKRSISFNWTTYEGWSTTNQYLVLNLNNAGFSKLLTLTPNQTNIEIKDITLGDRLCYYIRTQEIATKKTSSSNTVCFQTRKLTTPSRNYLSNVTVENDALIKISFDIEKQIDTDSLIVEKSEGKSPFVRFTALKSNPLIENYILEDLHANFNNFIYSYRVKTIDKCQSISSISNIGTSILLLEPLLTGNAYNFKWNLYVGYENGIRDQTIETSTNRFTWNIYQTENNLNTQHSFLQESINSDSICFRITNNESLNSHNKSSSSISNVRCIYKIEEFYLPRTINPLSNNNIFRVYGLGLDKSRGKMEIYNRWGEKIYETTNLYEGWNGKIYDEFAPLGSYAYKVFFYDQKNNYHLKTGAIFVIR